MYKTMSVLIVMGLLWAACRPSALPPLPKVYDPHSNARAEQAYVTHMALDVRVDFDNKQISGRATFDVVVSDKNTLMLTLDTRGLTIDSVKLDQGSEIANYVLDTNIPNSDYANDSSAIQISSAQATMGQALRISVAPTTKKAHVYYHTGHEADALQWLAPAQTEGQKKPFLFTQSQPNLARTWFPCQDSPGIRMTYEARVQVPPGLMAVMSAESDTVLHADGIYHFRMTHAIPSYLVALAVGDFGFRPLGPRSGVYAEHTMLARAAAEFTDVEAMIAAAEKLYGPYLWGRYDLIVLPPSFPYGGMENPMMTFATPTIVAGDRSLVSLVAHELAHSWSGNLVTNATWGDSWINEGFTTYFERRIDEAVFGRSFSEMEAHLGHQDMQAALKELGTESPLTKLRLDLNDLDPDAGHSGIIYDKGYHFLRFMEEQIGRDRWDAFLRKYFATFAFQSMTSERLMNYMRTELIRGDRALEEKLQLDQWILGTGLPSVCPVPQSDAFTKVEEEVKKWKSGVPAKQLLTSSWQTQQWMHFLRLLPENMNTAQLTSLDEAFSFTRSGNAEIQFEWFQHVITHKYTPAYARLEHYLTHIGRRKLVFPLYRKMASDPEMRIMAKRIYAVARRGYHPVTYGSIDEILLKK
ncbi:MAG TPA: M1 family metallopeptidase [bacterium]|nr:M1 family metallopeptidase [bacterium]HNO91390.1 M1 family metallopeptidase [bacterium]